MSDGMFEAIGLWMVEACGVHPDSAQNYVSFATSTPLDRTSDAMPLITDEGLVRLEWERDEHAYTAEIGPQSMYLCDLAPDEIDDWDEECDFSLDALRALFMSGRHIR